MFALISAKGTGEILYEISQLISAESSEDFPEKHLKEFSKKLLINTISGEICTHL